MFRHRHRGERPHLQANEINLWNQSAVDLQSLRKVLTTSERERDELAWTVPVRNDTASQVGIGTTLALGPVIMPLAIDDTVDLAFSAVDVASNNDIPCVLVEPIRPGFIGRAVVSGVTKALIDGTSFTTQRFARPMAGNLLEPSTEGSIRLLDSPGTGVTMVPVILGSGGGGAGQTEFRFTLTADLAAVPLSVASAVAANGAVINVVNSGRFRGFTGAQGMAISAGGLLFVVHIDQPALRIFCTLEDNPNSSGTNDSGKRFGADPRETSAYVDAASMVMLTPYPFGLNRFSTATGTVQIPNPHRLFGESGDGCVIAWNPATAAYFVEEIFPQRQHTMWCRLYSDRPHGLDQQIRCMRLGPASDGAFPTEPFDVRDRYNVAFNAKTNHQLLAQWDAVNDEYVAIECEHIATKVFGYVSVDFDDAPDEFDVRVLRAMDGIMPDPIDITVKNRWKWRTAINGDEIEVHWDGIVGEWYPMQIKPYESLLPQYFN